MAEVPDKLRILMFGKSIDKKMKLMTFITGNQGFILGVKHSVAASGEWKGNRLKVVRTPDLLNLSVETLIEEMKSCVSKCSPGPNVLLLLVKPSGFTEKDRETFNFLLSLFGPDAFKHAMVVITHDEKEHSCADVLNECHGRFYNMFEENRQVLMEDIESIVQQNKESYLTMTKITGIKHINIPPSLNLVLCGSRGAEKSSVVESILSQAAAPSPGQCVKHQGEVCGRWVSLVELPALSGKPLEAVMQQCLSCISLCGPEGVHAFILVLPVGPLTDEDKAELKTIQDTFSSAVNPFTMILFTVDSDLTAPAKIDFVQRDRDVQELSQSCGRRFDFFHLSDKKHVQKFIDNIKDTSAPKEQPHMYTTGMFWSAQAEKIIQQTNLQKTSIFSEHEKLSPQTLRIVLIGKTGSGKSSSGNTILGRNKVFKSDLSQTSVTKVCQKELSTVDGRHVAVVDTPGLFDSTMSNEEVIEEMSSCVSLLSPGPHVFLLVLEIGRFTPEEKETLRLIKQHFGKDAEKFTMILFTHGDKLKQHEVSLDQFIKEKFDDSCKKLISDCGNRYHLFDNLDKNNQDQVIDLIKKIDDMVLENGGGCFTTEMFQEAEVSIKKEMKRILQEKEEEIQREREFLKNKYKQEMEEINQKMEAQKNEIEKERLLREKELKEKEQKIEEERAIREREQKKREDEDKQRKEQEKQQRQDWEEKHKALEDKIKSSEESKETIDRKLKETRKQMEQEREDLEKERQTWWAKRKQEEDEGRKEEKQRLRKLQDEIEQERESDRIKRQVEDRIRQEQERKERQKVEEKHHKQVEELRKAYEEKARKTAEEFNDFKDKKQEEMETLINLNIKHVQDLQKQYEDEKNDMCRNYTTTMNESEAILKNQITDLQLKHKQEMSEMVICMLTKKKKNKNDIQSIKKKHQKELENVYEEIEDEFKKKEKKGLKELKTKLDNAIKDLKRNTVNKEDLKNEKKRLCLENEKEQLELKAALHKEQTDSEGPRKAELQKKHQQELSEFMQELLKENEAQTAKLQSKQEKEMKELKERMTPQNEESRKEAEELEKKHIEEMKQLKDKLLTPEEKPCLIS